MMPLRWMLEAMLPVTWLFRRILSGVVEGDWRLTHFRYWGIL